MVAKIISAFGPLQPAEHVGNRLQFHAGSGSVSLNVKGALEAMEGAQMDAEEAYLWIVEGGRFWYL